MLSDFPGAGIRGRANRKVTMKKEYIVGAEKSLGEIIKDIDLIPFFRSAVESGIPCVMLEDSRGDVLCHWGNPSGEGMITLRKPVYLEGEAAGYVVVRGDEPSRSRIEAAAELILNAVNTILRSSFKSVLATETHMAVVDQSYNELLETNRRLQLSEGRYRDLADTLEKQVHERTEELRQALATLLHQEKIASVGQLAAGVAHEINNPLGFIVSNLNTLNQYVSRFRDMLVLYRSAFENGEFTDENRALTRRKWGDYKLDFILPDAADLIRESLDGAERVRKIVADLKDFSHIDDGDRAGVDINREIDRTLNVLTHEIPGDAEIIRDYRPLPEFTCSPAHICQAFFNIILNALQTGKEGLKLIITTRYEKDFIRISFSDNGPGIPEEITNRIFEPFFTTKEVGKGTGMGLKVTYDIITSYGGTIEVKSVPGSGAAFGILLPVAKKENNVIREAV